MYKQNQIGPKADPRRTGEKKKMCNCLQKHNNSYLTEMKTIVRLYQIFPPNVSVSVINWVKGCANIKKYKDRAHAIMSCS